MVENRVIGIKSREVYEAPAAVVLHAAHRDLQAVVLARDLERLMHRPVRSTYADLVYDGQWFTPMREALDAFFAKVQERVTGTFALKLFKGHCLASWAGRRRTRCTIARWPPYDAGDAFDHAAAERVHQDGRAARWPRRPGRRRRCACPPTRRTKRGTQHEHTVVGPLRRRARRRTSSASARRSASTAGSSRTT